jgi:hypothetical protein
VNGDGVNTPYGQHLACECDWTFHRGKPCLNPPADHGPVILAPVLCTSCLWVCCAEREDVGDLDERFPLRPGSPA